MDPILHSSEEVRDNMFYIIFMDLHAWNTVTILSVSLINTDLCFFLAKTAILHDVCVGDGKVILRASVESEVNIGDDVHFNNCKQTSKIYNCISFSMQGIFTKTQFGEK